MAAEATDIINDSDVQGTYQLNKLDNDNIEVEVRGVNIGRTTLTITAEADGYTSETASVRVDVLESLRIAATPVSVVLVQGASTQINVSVSRVVGASVTVDIDATDGLSVAPSSVTLANTDALEVTVMAGDDYSGPATLTLTATDYTTATVTVMILDDDLVVTVTAPDGGSLISVDEGR